MSEEITITFPDLSKEEFRKGITPLEIAEKISRRLAEEAVAAKANDKLVDLTMPILEDSKIEILKFDSKEGKEVFWHSTNHVLANAVKELWPDAKLGIGPAIENGFYYDFDKKEPFTPEDLKKIEEKMKEIVKRNLKIERLEVDKKKAEELSQGETYRLELIDEMDEKDISMYKQGDFIDLCRGPHVTSTGKIRAFKLTKIAGAYWRGDQKNKQLQRIYGISFPEEKQLKEYLHNLEEAEKRDHRKIGKELDLFSLHEEGPGFIFWHPKGTIIYNELVNFIREQNNKRGYQEVRTPALLHNELWKRSGHWDNFKENMYGLRIDEQDYAVKPMNCPGACLIYKTHKHSYKELPLRLAEFGHVHRHELAGVISGLFRVRAFTQDDAHIYATFNSLENEIIAVIDYVLEVYKTLGFNEYAIFIANRPEKSTGTEEQWEKATQALKNAVENKGLKYGIKEGEGAFYGPKIEFNIKDSLGRNWQCGTVQVDFSMPERFDLSYMGEDGQDIHRPVMIHKAILGSLERFIGVLVEHYAGKLPLWLSPEQVRILTIADRFEPYAKEIERMLEEKGVRVKIDSKAETLNKKVRTAELDKVNYILVVGEKEVNEKTVNVRTRDNKIIGAMKADEFLSKILEEIRERRV